MFKMSKKQKRKLIIGILVIITLIFSIERIYNSRDEFQVVAEDASHYGIVEAKLTKREKLKDFKYLYDTLKENYPFFKVNERLHGIDWLGNKRKYKRMVKNTKNDAEFFVAIDTILRDLNNGHVNIFNGYNYRWFRNFYHKSYSIGNYQKYLPMYQVFVSPFVEYRYKIHADYDEDKTEDIKLFDESVLKTKVLIEDKVAYMKIEKMAAFDTQIKDYDKVKEFANDIEDYEKLIIDIRGNGGGNVNYWKNIVQLFTDEHLSVRYYSFFKDGHREGALEPYKVRGLTTINNLDEEILEEFPEEVKTDFDFYKKFSIHIHPWEGSTDALDHVDFRGEIYLLVDRGVFSASETFAAFAKDSGFATLVGEPTGGDRVFAEIPIVFLPQSKFAIRYSRELVMNVDGTINMEAKTIPHIEVDPTPHEDFNKDKCIQAVIDD